MKIQETEFEETSPVFSPSQKPTENSNDLKLKRERIERDVDNPTTRRMEVFHRDVEELQRLAKRVKKGCFFGLGPNVKACNQLIKKAEDISKAAADLLLAGQFPNAPPQGLRGLRFPSIKDYETLTSEARLLEEIMEGLKHPHVSTIGIWGMGGVGKTTLVKKAAEQAIIDWVFDVVIFLEVSLNLDSRRIQGEIADALDLKFKAETIVGRSYQLRECLQKETKILVILDDIWASLDLELLGMPSRDDHKRFKILMTSRDEQVLTKMGTNSLNIRVDALDDGVAWNSFEKMEEWPRRNMDANFSSIHRSMSFRPDRVRVRGRSSAFNAVTANFENLNARNISTPPPVVRKIYPKSVTPDSAELASTSSANAALTSSFQQPPPARKSVIPRSVKGSPEAPKASDSNSKENSVRSRIESLTIQDVKEGEDWGGFFTHPYGNTGHPYRARPGPRQSKRLP